MNNNVKVKFFILIRKEDITYSLEQAKRGKPSKLGIESNIP